MYFAIGGLETCLKQPYLIYCIHKS